jgi:hypothetical protein
MLLILALIIIITFKKGDSLGKFIDAGFPLECPALNQSETRPRYSLEHGNVTLEYSIKNDLTIFASRAFQALSLGPEDFCYVGVEGNPVFTSRLQKLEARVMNTKPKPIRAAHFYTESVGAGVDGPTFLYLDERNVAQNFWGSSIFATHRDVVARGDATTIQAPVMGLTLTTLLKRSVLKTNGSHVLMKIDIEGGEFPLMNEAIGTLCEYTQAGVRVEAILETHHADVLGGRNPEMDLFYNVTEKRLRECNVQLRDLSVDYLELPKG